MMNAHHTLFPGIAFVLLLLVVAIVDDATVAAAVDSSQEIHGKATAGDNINTNENAILREREQQQQQQQQQQQENAIPTKFLGLNVHGDPVYMPLIGAGTWQYNDDDAYESVCKAFAAGYTFVDTAYGYKNQKGVGKAIKNCWKGNRTDLFVMTKIPGELSLSSDVI